MKHTLVALLLVPTAAFAQPSQKPLIATSTILAVMALPDGGTLVTCGRGTSYDVTMAASCEFVDRSNKSVSKDCTMHKVDERTIQVYSKTMRIDDVKAAGVVMFRM